MLFALIVVPLVSLTGCNQNRYQPSQWRRVGTTVPPVEEVAANDMGNYSTLPGRASTLPGRASTLPGRWYGSTLPGRGSTLPGRATTLPTREWRGSTLPLRNPDAAEKLPPAWYGNDRRPSSRRFPRGSTLPGR